MGSIGLFLFLLSSVVLCSGTEGHPSFKKWDKLLNFLSDASQDLDRNEDYGNAAILKNTGNEFDFLDIINFYSYFTPTPEDNQNFKNKFNQFIVVIPFLNQTRDDNFSSTSEYNEVKDVDFMDVNPNFNETEDYFNFTDVNPYYNQTEDYYNFTDVNPYLNQTTDDYFNFTFIDLDYNKTEDYFNFTDVNPFYNQTEDYYNFTDVNPYLNQTKDDYFNFTYIDLDYNKTEDYFNFTDVNPYYNQTEDFYNFTTEVVPKFNQTEGNFNFTDENDNFNRTNDYTNFKDVSSDFTQVSEESTFKTRNFNNESATCGSKICVHGICKAVGEESYFECKCDEGYRGIECDEKTTYSLDKKIVWVLIVLLIVIVALQVITTCCFMSKRRRR